MQPQVIIVHGVKDAINDVGVRPYANTLVQEMAGGYFFVELEAYRERKPYFREWDPFHPWNEEACPIPEDESEEIEARYLYWRIHSVPRRLAWFVIDALRLKSQAVNLGSGEHPDSKQAVYLTPGKEIMGQKIRKLTEIPAELRPVVVERL